jgi:S-DNA-T family DNA segregation ATPase FtsK/SpoIIIE
MAFWSRKKKRAGKNKKKRPAAGRRPSKRRGGGGAFASAFELAVFVCLCGAIYLIGALSDSVWTGARGRMLGVYLRETGGGALLVPLLFFLYLCAAWFAGSKIPRALGQILGTAQIYLTTVFALGLFREARWDLPWLLAEPGAVGEGLARFFLLNGGVLGAVIVAFSSLALSAILYGFKLPVRLFRALTARVAERWNAVPESSRNPESSWSPESPRIPETRKEIPALISKGAFAPVSEGAFAPVSEGAFAPVSDSAAVYPCAVQAEAPVRTEAPAQPETSAPEAALPAETSALSETPALPEASAIPMLRVTAAEPPLLSGTDAPPDSPPREGGLASAVQGELPGVELPEDIDIAGQRFHAGMFPPPLDIFGPPAKIDEEDVTSALAGKQAEVIVKTLQDFGVKSNVAHIVIGPSVIQFQLELAPGIKVSKVSGLANDLTMALAVVSVRVEAPILGQRYVGIEIPNPRRKGITLRSLMESEAFQEGEFTLPLPMGVRVDSQHLVCGLEEMPHLLVAGTTGSGKSVFTNTCILGMCSQRSPDELKLILVDPKHVEFAIYEGLPHLLARPVSDPKKAVAALTWAVQEMETRSEAFAGARVRNLASYNEKVLPKDRFPHIVVVVDELADLMYTAGKEVENLIARLAQKARAAGIHLILATQRPSVDVITGLIKANVPARVAFAVPSQTDSRTIIDTGGAEKLLGKGDMLFYSARYPRPLRLQASFITEERTLEFVEYMRNVFGEPECIEFEDLPNGGAGEERPGSRDSSPAADPKLAEAIRVVMNTGIASASGLQRHLNIGYPRAGRLISGLELLGIVGPQPANSSKPREILMDEDTALEVLDRAKAGSSADMGMA